MMSAQPRRHLGDDLADGPRRLVAHALEHGQRAAGAEGRPAAGHHVQHAAQAEQVGAVVERLAAGLFGGHVHRRARHDPPLRDAGVVRRAGQPEVGELGAQLRVAFEQHVGRLDVAVDQLVGVGGGQPLGHLPADAQDLRHLERPGAVDPLLEGLAGDELHHQIRQRLFGDLVDLHDVLVPHRGRRAGLAEETLARRGGGRQLRRQHLDRDHAVQHVVEGAEDDAEAAVAEDFQDLVMAHPAERVGPGREQKGRRARGRRPAPRWGGPA